MFVNIMLQFHAEVHVFARSTAVFEFDDPRIHVHRYGKPFADSAWYLRLSGQLIYQLRYALGIVKWSSQLGLVVIGGSGFVVPAIASRICGVYTIYRIGGVSYKEVPSRTRRQRIWSRFLKTFQRLQYSLVQTIVVLSPSLMSFADLGKFSTKCRVFNHYYFDTELFRRETDYGSRDPVVGHIGVSRTKGTMQLLQAFDRSGLNETYRLLVVGDGQQLDSAKQFADQRELNVTFTGYVGRTEMPTYYNRMRLFVNCSESEGVPKAIFESMACGTPVAATAVGGVPDYITDGQTGYLLDGNDPAQLAEYLQRILGEPDLESVAERSYEQVLANFSYESTLSQYHDLVTSVTDLRIPSVPDDPDEPVPRHVEIT